MFEIVTLNELQDALASSPHDWELVYDGLVDEVAECNHLVVYAAGHVLLSVVLELGSEILDSLSVYAFSSGNATFIYQAPLSGISAYLFSNGIVKNIQPVMTDEYFSDNCIDTDDVDSLYSCFSLGDPYDSKNEKIQKVLDLLSGLQESVKERFYLTIKALQDKGGSGVISSQFKNGALLMNSNSEFFRFFGVKDTNGDFILKNLFVGDYNKVPAENLGEYREVDGIPFLAEILKSFYFFFDKSVVARVAAIAGAGALNQLSAVLGYADLFTEYGKARKKVIVNKSGVVDYDINFKNPVCPWHVHFDALRFSLYFNLNGVVHPDLEGFFNPFYFACGLHVVSRFFAAVYDAFYSEIEQLGLKQGFQKISEFWVYVSETFRVTLFDAGYADSTDSPTFKKLQDLEGYQMVKSGSTKAEKISGFKDLLAF